MKKLLRRAALVVLGTLAILLNYQLGLNGISGGYFYGAVYALILLGIEVGFRNVSASLIEYDKDENIELGRGLIFIFVYGGVAAAIYHLGLIKG